VVSSPSLFDAPADRVALVTGAASGIGAATATRLAQQGIGGLVLLDRDPAGLQSVGAALQRTAAQVLCRAQDIADETAWDATAAAVGERFGRLDLAVANAGLATGRPIVDCSLEEWRRVMSVNLDGVFLTLKHALGLIQQGERGGAIVVVASAAAIKAESGTGPYGASKAGALQLARVAAKEGAPARIRVNAVLPGGVQTPLWQTVPFFQDLVKEKGSEAAAFAALHQVRPRCWPNTRMVAYADALLSRNGALIAALKAHQREILRHHPDIADLVRGVGRADELPD
jgi:NAD(P)-dependent dehydrogenase (short-subunit alcohol dehydrogenase family)